MQELHALYGDVGSRCLHHPYLYSNNKGHRKKREKSRSRGRKQARQEQHTKKHDRDACTQLHKNRTTTAVRRNLLLRCNGGSGGSVVMRGRKFFVMTSSFFNRFGHNDHIVCRVVTVVLATIIEFEIIDIKVRSMIILYRFY